MDEDCDGTVDNGCTCQNGQTKDCCAGTQITCAGGAWPSCPTPPTETCNSKDDDCNGLVDDKLPVSPYQLEEDISNVNDCDHAKQVATPVTEAAGAVSVQGYLYKPDLTADSDFFAFQATEDSDFSCILNPMYYECYAVTVRLTPPAGTSYQFCVYDVGYQDGRGHVRLADREGVLDRGQQRSDDQLPGRLRVRRHEVLLRGGQAGHRRRRQLQALHAHVREPRQHSAGRHLRVLVLPLNSLPTAASTPCPDRTRR